MTERYHLTLEPLPGWPDRREPIPADARLRAALKRLLRQHGLRCVDARAIGPEPRTETTGDEPKGSGQNRGPPAMGPLRGPPPSKR